MKKKIFLSLAALCLLFAGGCDAGFMMPLSGEISDIELILTLGIDRLDDGRVEMTFAGGEQSFSGPQGGSNEPIIFSTRASTLSMAAKSAGMMSDKNIFLGNVEQVLIGEKMARSGIEGCVDYLIRDVDMRPGTSLFVAKGSARELMGGAGSGDAVDDKLSATLMNSRQLSRSGSYSLADAGRQLFSNQLMVIPAVGVQEGEVTLEGYGVFKGQQLESWLPDEESIGYNLITNSSRDDVLEVKDLDGRLAALNVLSSKVKCKPLRSGESIVAVELELEVRLSLNEVQSRQGGFTKEQLEHLEEQARHVEEGRMRAATDASQAMNSDFLGIARSIEQKYPLLWRKIKGDWAELYPQLPIYINVDSKLERTYELIGSAKVAQ